MSYFDNSIDGIFSLPRMSFATDFHFPLKLKYNFKSISCTQILEPENDIPRGTCVHAKKKILYEILNLDVCSSTVIEMNMNSKKIEYLYL